MKTGIVGCGKVGHLHASALQSIAGSEFVGACNHNIARAEEYARQYGVRAYDSVGRMIDELGIEMVCITTPHMNHRAPAVEAIEHGAHVIIEKPMAITLSDCDAILEAAQRHGRMVSVVSQRRLYAPCQRMKRAIEGGKIGRPILGTVTMLGWRDMDYYASDRWRGSWAGEGGGVLVNQAVHQLDLLLWYMGEVQSVAAEWATLNHPRLEVEDTAVAALRFKSGALGSILVSNSVNPALYGNVHVHGENGAAVGVQTDGGAMFIAGQSGILEPPVNDLWTVPGEADMLAQWRAQDGAAFLSQDQPQHHFTEQIGSFLGAIDTGTAPAVTGEEARRAVALFQAIYESGRTGRRVLL